MSILKKFKDLMGIEEIEEEEFEDDISGTGEQSDRKGMDSKFATSRSREGKEKFPSMQTSRATSPFKLVVIEPQSFEECPKLVDSLKSRRPVIINLEKIIRIRQKNIRLLKRRNVCIEWKRSKSSQQHLRIRTRECNITGSNENKGFDFNSTIKDSWR